jgi:sulfite exporter TauE/SafE
MFKVIGLIFAGVFLLAFGVYFLSNAELPPFNIHLPDVNWAIVGFVVIAGSLATFGTAFVVARLN